MCAVKVPDNRLKVSGLLPGKRDYSVGAVTIVDVTVSLHLSQDLFISEKCKYNFFPSGAKF